MSWEVHIVSKIKDTEMKKSLSKVYELVQSTHQYVCKNTEQAMNYPNQHWEI